MIPKTLFFSSLISYGVFWISDLLIPGFVSRYFSVHLFLLCALFSGIWWASVVKEYEERLWLHWCVSFGLGIFVGVLTWNLSSEADAYRIVLTGFAFVLPIFLYKLIKQ